MCSSNWLSTTENASHKRKHATEIHKPHWSRSKTWSFRSAFLSKQKDVQVHWKRHMTDLTAVLGYLPRIQSLKADLNGNKTAFQKAFIRVHWQILDCSASCRCSTSRQQKKNLTSPRHFSGQELRWQISAAISIITYQTEGSELHFLPVCVHSLMKFIKLSQFSKQQSLKKP